MTQPIPSVSVSDARNGRSTSAKEPGMRPMQERAHERRGEQCLLTKSPASGKSQPLMFIALDKLHNHGLKQAIIVVPETFIGASFDDEPSSQSGFRADWLEEPEWSLYNAPGTDNGDKVSSLGAFLASDDKALVCTLATFRFVVDQFGVEAFDDRLIAVDEFHHVPADPEIKPGAHLGRFIARDRAHVVAMTSSHSRGDAEAALAPQDEAKFDPAGKSIVHISNVNSRESTKDKIREVEHIIEQLGEWHPPKPGECFLVPLRVIDEAVQRIRDGSITNLVYDPATATLLYSDR